MALNPYFAPSMGGGQDWSVTDPFYSGAGDWAMADPFSIRNLAVQNQRNLANTMQSMKPFSPLLSTDLIESETDFHVHVDLPGVAANDLDITCANGMLTIRAERKEVHEVDTDTVHRTEKNYGKVQRNLALPRNADITNANAKLESGVLTVSFPKLEGAVGAKRILIA